MDFQTLLTHCQAKPGTELTQPFGDDTWVLKVGGKVYALVDNQPVVTRLSVKCDPERALELRASYPAIRGGYHLNKRHWNTLHLDEHPFEPRFILEQIDHSYELVFAGLSRQRQEGLRAANPPAEG
jgi:predicted DNA-binding protein (MmcQ/YjbR family)